MQLDQQAKGFSFSKEGPLDMRMDPSSDLTAFEIVNKWSEQQLGKIFQEYGEEPKWKQAAHAIVEARRKTPILTTTQLASLLQSTLKRSFKKKLHPATLIFQALRICVNRELEAIEKGIRKAISLLSQKGIIGVISFHSLEDRIVKNIFRENAAKSKNKQKEGQSTKSPLLKIITKKPLRATFDEIRLNRRARSALLRLAEKN